MPLYFIAALAPAGLNTSQETALSIGLFVGTGASVLAVVWIVLQIIGWFRPKESYATKAELASLKTEIDTKLSGLDKDVKSLTNSIQHGFGDVQRAIGRLEGKLNV